MNAVHKRHVALILTDNGGAELVDRHKNTLWASDSDEDFREEFPDFLDEEDTEHLLDYLCAKEIITDDEAYEAEVLMESIKAETPPGDEDDDDDEDEIEDEFDDDEEDDD